MSSSLFTELLKAVAVLGVFLLIGTFCAPKFRFFGNFCCPLRSSAALSD